MFDSIQVKFNNKDYIKSPFANTKQVQFDQSYLNVIKQHISSVTTEYFWLFADFVDINCIDLDFIPEQHERDQIHCWYDNSDVINSKEGNIFLIPTRAFKQQMAQLKFLREYNHVNYHPAKIIQANVQNTIKKYRIYYTDKKVTRRFSSFWEAEHGGVVFINNQSFDSVQIKFDNASSQSPWKNTREVPFKNSYLETIRSVVDSITTEYFWVFADFVDMSTADIYLSLIHI